MRIIFTISNYIQITTPLSKWTKRLKWNTFIRFYDNNTIRNQHGRETTQRWTGWSSKIEIDNRVAVAENGDDSKGESEAWWYKFPSRVSYQAWNKSGRFGAQRGTEGAKRKNEFMERSLDGVWKRDCCPAGLRARLVEAEHVPWRKRFDDKFNFAELAGGTCKLPRNELCYIVLGVQLEFRRENRVTGAVGTG